MNFTSVVKLIEDLHKTGFVVKVNGSMDSVVVEHIETKIKSNPLYLKFKPTPPVQSGVILPNGTN